MKEMILTALKEIKQLQKHVKREDVYKVKKSTDSLNAILMKLLKELEKTEKK